jgi:hypothetical protein
LSTRGIRSITAMAGGVADLVVSRALRQLEDRVRDFIGHWHDVFTRALDGFVPAPGGTGTTRFLREDGTWVAPAGGGGGGAPPDADYGDITVSGGVWNLDAGVVGNTELRNGAATSVVGRSANTVGSLADIAAGSDGDVLRRAAGALGFGTIPEASVANLTTDLGNKQPLDTTLTMLSGIKHVLTADKTIPDGYGTYMPRYLEVAAGVTLTIGADADLEVG